MINLCNPDYSNTPVSRLRPRYGYVCGHLHALPAISIITPFFNAGNIFHQTVESVLGQSFQQWEWIIVDDGSDEPASITMLEQHAHSDPRIQVVHSAVRSGPAAARNLGVARARAPYVAFIDSDDLYEPTALEKWLWFLESHSQFGMVKGFQVGFGAEEYLWREGFHSGSAILEHNLIQTASLVRRDVYLEVGGMDEAILGGMEDWDFWLKCANTGVWGGTVPEFLDWYRRRPSHNDRWQDWDQGRQQAAFREQLKRRYPRLFEGSFPAPAEEWPVPFAELPALPSFDNRLERNDGAHRLLILVPHLVAGGSDKYIVDLISELIPKHHYEVTIVSTQRSDDPWRHCFEAHTPDVFTLHTFLRLCDYPRFLRYLIRSRGIHSVVVTHSALGYRLLPYLRSQCPEIRCYDYVHIEEPDWMSGGYPALSVAYASFLNRTAASSRHLKDWMTARGRCAESISVVTTNIDTGIWHRRQFDGATLRKKWDIPNDVPVILFAGRLVPQKQPEVLARTLQILHEQGLRFLCLIAGDGESGAWLRDFVRDNGLGGLRLLGYRSNEEVRELLAVSDILLLPSKHEGIALSLFEAMAMEVVPVTANVGGQAELVTPDCGVLIEPGGDEAARYAAAIEKLLSDSDRRARMACAACRRVTESFQLEQMGQVMAVLLQGKHERTSAFDPVIAAREFPLAHAREVIEHCRLESAADALWAERAGKAATVPVLTANGAAASQAVHGGSRWLNALAMLRPLFAGEAHRRNRQLLFRILRHASARRELLTTFDSKFYTERYPDVPGPAPLPLLHFVFHGYREGRHPASAFDEDTFSRRQRNASPTDTNPLLSMICERLVREKS